MFKFGVTKQLGRQFLSKTSFISRLAMKQTAPLLCKSPMLFKHKGVFGFSKRICFTCDLKDDPKLMAEYKKWHAPGGVWPEILEGIKECGIEDLQIYNQGNRMFMIMEIGKNFSQEKSDAFDQTEINKKWQKLMWKYQQPVPGAKPGEKWVEMDKIFQL